MPHENNDHSSGQLPSIRLGCKVLEPGQVPRIQHGCNHHEQECTMATEGDACNSGQFVVVNVTIGPRGINALNGVFGVWADSIPMLVVSGQVNHEAHLRTPSISGLRPYGDGVTVRGTHV
jgi:acetolactate synthase-1/2/3 large subunit